MKKQLKKLKAEANKNLKEYYKANEDLDHAREQKKDDRMELSKVCITSLFAVKSLVEYINALRPYTSELEETFDTALKPKKQSKPEQKKDETKKTSYIE